MFNLINLSINLRNITNVSKTIDLSKIVNVREIINCMKIFLKDKDSKDLDFKHSMHDGN